MRKDEWTYVQGTSYAMKETRFVNRYELETYKSYPIFSEAEFYPFGYFYPAVESFRIEGLSSEYHGWQIIP